MSKTKEALKLAIELLEDDLATLTREQAADYKERYAGGYKPERVKYANDLVVRTEKLIEACKEALAEQSLTRDWKETILERINKDDEFKEVLAKQLSGNSEPLSDDEICDLYTKSMDDIKGVNSGCSTQQHYFARLLERAHGIGE